MCKYSPEFQPVLHLLISNSALCRGEKQHSVMNRYSVHCRVLQDLKKTCETSSRWKRHVSKVSVWEVCMLRCFLGSLLVLGLLFCLVWFFLSFAVAVQKGSFCSVTPVPSTWHPYSHGNHRRFSIFFSDRREAGAGSSSFALPAVPCPPAALQGGAWDAERSFTWRRGCTQLSGRSSVVGWDLRANTARGVSHAPGRPSAVLCQATAMR